MSRLDTVSRFRGDAAGPERALENPLELISRPVFLQANGQPLPEHERWELPRVPVGGCVPEEFKKYVGSKSLFVIGGFDLITEFGLLPSWYCRPDTRDAAKELIKKRDWGELLQQLKGKENQDDDLFGQKSIRDFFACSPPVQRNDAELHELQAEPRSDEEIAENRLRFRTGHALRLRKAIEFIVLTEVMLEYRFNRRRTRDRFHRFFDLPEDAAFSEVVWQYLWIEPACYCVSAPARLFDLEDIMRRQELRDRFVDASKQLPGALYYALKGAPGKYRTISAACEVLNSVYSGLGRAAPRTVLPFEFDDKMKIFDEDARLEYQKEMEFLPELGPEKS